MDARHLTKGCKFRILVTLRKCFEENAIINYFLFFLFFQWRSHFGFHTKYINIFNMFKMWSLRGHTMSALNLGFNSRFLMSIPTLSYTKSSPPPPRVRLYSPSNQSAKEQFVGTTWQNWCFFLFPLGLDFYGCIKFINFIRKMVVNPKIICTNLPEVQVSIHLLTGLLD